MHLCAGNLAVDLRGRALPGIEEEEEATSINVLELAILFLETMEL